MCCVGIEVNGDGAGGGATWQNAYDDCVEVVSRRDFTTGQASQIQTIVARNNSVKKHARIIILATCKGDATVIMNTVDYYQMIRKLLESETYRRIPWDPHIEAIRKCYRLITDVRAAL